MRYKYYKDKRCEWRRRVKASNGQIIGVSGEGYVNKINALHDIDLVKAFARMRRCSG